MTTMYCDLEEAFGYVTDSQNGETLAEDGKIKIMGIPCDDGSVNLEVIDEGGEKIDEINVGNADECESELDGFIDFYLDYLNREFVIDGDIDDDWKNAIEEDDDADECENEYDVIFDDLLTMCYGANNKSIDPEEFKETILATIASKFGRDIKRPMLLGNSIQEFPYLDTRFWEIVKDEFGIFDFS